MREHQRAKFVELTGTSPDQLAIALFGAAGSGKSRLAATMPGKVGIIPLDRKTRRTIERVAKGLGLPKGKIVFPADDLVRLGKPMQLMLMDNDAAIRFYREHVNRIKDAVFTLAEDPKIDSIVIDSGTQLAEDVLFANYGRDQKIMPRDRGAFNSEMKQILVSVQHKQFLMTHEARAIWRNDKPTDKNEARGWSNLEYNVNLLLEMIGPPDESEFGVKVRLCQDSPQWIGEKLPLSGEDINFTNIATLIYPDGSWDE